MKGKRLEKGCPPVIGIVFPTSRKASIQVPLEGDAPYPPATLWSDVVFDTLQFKSLHLPFSKEFPGDYQAFQYKLTPVIISMKDNLLLRALMLEDVDRKR